MTLFIIGLIILLGGGYLYSKYVESQLEPDDRETPAVKKADGVDFVVMSKTKNWLINLLNIAGTGPILGPIQGILFCIYCNSYWLCNCRCSSRLHDRIYFYEKRR